MLFCMLTIERLAGDRGVTLILRGALDGPGARRLQDALPREEEAAGRLTLDLARVDCVTAAGLRVLLGHFRAGGAGTVLRAPRPPVHRLLDVAGLTRLYPVEAGGAR